MAEKGFNRVRGEHLDWTLLPDTATDIPTCSAGIITPTVKFISHELKIVVAHIDANDAGANDVYVSVMTQAGPTPINAEDWRQISGSPFRSGGKQATASALDANSGASQANPERIQVVGTGDFDTGQLEDLFLLDAGTLVDSCLVKIKGWADGDYYICKWDLERDYDSSDLLYDKVSFHNVELPRGCITARVDFGNSDGAANYAVRIDYEEITGIE